MQDLSGRNLHILDLRSVTEFNDDEELSCCDRQRDLALAAEGDVILDVCRSTYD